MFHCYRSLVDKLVVISTLSHPLSSSVSQYSSLRSLNSRRSFPPSLPLLASSPSSSSLFSSPFFRQPYRNMNVHKYNFKTVWPDIEAALERASFVAIDTELTGLYTLPSYRAVANDSLDTRYCRVRNSAEHLGIVQYGIAIFEYETGTNTLLCRPYSFHLWPQTSPMGLDNGTIGYGSDVTFTVTSESFTFLNDHNFNFNQWISQGISFLSREGEEKIRHDRRLNELRKFMKIQESEENTPNNNNNGGSSSNDKRLPTRIVIYSKPPVPVTSNTMETTATTTITSTSSTSSSSTPSSTINTTVTTVTDKPHDSSTPTVSTASTEASSSSSASASSSTAATTDTTTVPPVPEEEVITITNDPDIEWYKETTKILDDWLMKMNEYSQSSLSSLSSSSSVPSSDEFEIYTNPNTGTQELFPYLLLAPINGFRRRIIYSYIENTLVPKSSFLTETKFSDQVNNPDKFSKRIRIVYIGPGTSGKLVRQSCELRQSLYEVERSIQHAVGFRHIIDKITSKRLPVICHNGLLDIVHSGAKFMGSLPPNLADFADQISRLYPFIYDTKQLIQDYSVLTSLDPATNVAFQGKNSLGQAFDLTNSTCKVRVAKPNANTTKTNTPSAPGTNSTEAKTVNEVSKPKETEKSTVPKTTESTTTTTTTGTATNPSAATVLSSTPSGGWTKVGGNNTSSSTNPPNDRRKRGRNYNDPAVEFEEIEIPWTSYINIKLAPGFEYTNNDNDQPSDKSSNTDAMKIDNTVTKETAPVPTITALLQQEDKDMAHDAGYDAYMTGSVFAKVMCRLHAKQQEKITTTIVPNTTISTGTPPVDDSADTKRTKVESVSDSSSSSRNAASSTHSQVSMNIDDILSLSSSSSSLPLFANDAVTLTSLPLFRLFENRLFMMRIAHPACRTLNLNHAAQLSQLNQSMASSIDDQTLPELKTNTLLLARSQMDRSRTIYLTDLNISLKNDDIITVLTRHLNIPTESIDSYKDIVWIDDKSVFVQLPSYDTVQQLFAWLEQEKTLAKKYHGSSGSSSSSDKGTTLTTSTDIVNPSLLTLSIDTLFPEHVSSLVPPLSLSSFTVLTYQEWLKLNSRVFSNVCDHECVPKNLSTTSTTTTTTTIDSKNNNSNSNTTNNSGLLKTMVTGTLPVVGSILGSSTSQSESSTGKKNDTTSTVTTVSTTTDPHRWGDASF